MAKRKGTAKPEPEAPETAHGTDFEIEGVVPTSSLQGQLLSKRRKSKYGDLIARCAALRHGESIVIALPRGINPEVARNNISAAIKRKVAQAGAKGKMRFAVTADGKLAISCTPN